MMRLRALLAEAQVALMLLTRLPAGRLPPHPAAPPMARAAWAFPLVGFIVGMIGALTLLGAQLVGLPPDIAAGLALAATILATGGLHEDGLADVADGFGGGRDRARKLDIMRDSRIGSYGTLALILSVGMRWQLIGALGTAAAPGMVAAAVLSRGGLPLVMRFLPPAREVGLGRAAGGVSTGTALIAAALALLLALFAAGTLKTAAALIGTALALFLVARLAHRQIGGQTGDVLGAAQQAAEIAALLAVAAL